MAKDIPLDVLLKDADGHCKTLKGFADAAPKAATRIEGGFKKDKPDLDWITQEIASAEKWLGEIEHDIGKAEKTQKQLAKLKEADAKKAAKELDAALDKTAKEIEKLRTTMGVAEKIADKAEVEDKKLAPVMKRALELAEQRHKELSGDLVTCPRIVDHLGGIVAKIQAGTFPIDMYLSVAPVFVRDMAQIGARITSAESVASSLGTLAAKGAKAFLPEVRQGVEDCTATKKVIDAAVVKLRGEYNKGLKSAAEWRSSLADKIKKAA